MPTRKHPLLENHAYFVTTVTVGRHRLFAGEDAASLFVDCLSDAKRSIGFALLSFVVMADHIHLLVVPPPGVSISDIIRALKGRFSRLWNDATDSWGVVWQARFHAKVARGEDATLAYVRYIEDNPVQAGLAAEPANYPFSSAHRHHLSDIESYLSGAWGERFLHKAAGQARSLASTLVSDAMSDLTAEEHSSVCSVRGRSGDDRGRPGAHGQTRSLASTL